MSIAKKIKGDVNKSKYTQYRVMRRGPSPQYYIELRDPDEEDWETWRGTLSVYGRLEDTYYYTLEEAQEVILKQAKQDQLRRHEPEVVWEYPAPPEK